MDHMQAIRAFARVVETGGFTRAADSVHTLDFMVRPSIERGELIVVLPEYRRKPLEVFAVYPPSRQLSTKVRVFIEWVTQIYDRLRPP
jgi:DNA-binding transcriptional LysR family regulator